MCFRVSLTVSTRRWLDLPVNPKPYLCMLRWEVLRGLWLSWVPGVRQSQFP